MNDMNTIFRKLLGREPNDDEIQEILRVKDVLGLSRDDSLWGIYLLMKGHEQVVAGGVGRVEAAASAAKIKAEAEVQAIGRHGDKERAEASAPRKKEGSPRLGVLHH